MAYRINWVLLRRINKTARVELYLCNCLFYFGECAEFLRETRNKKTFKCDDGRSLLMTEVEEKEWNTSVILTWYLLPHIAISYFLTYHHRFHMNGWWRIRFNWTCEVGVSYCSDVVNCNWCACMNMWTFTYLAKSSIGKPFHRRFLSHFLLFSCVKSARFLIAY